MAFKMKYKKGGFPFKASPMKMAPALIAKLAPVAMQAMSGGGGGGGGGGEKPAPKETENKTRGLDQWNKDKESES